MVIIWFSFDIQSSIIRNYTWLQLISAHVWIWLCKNFYSLACKHLHHKRVFCFRRRFRCVIISIKTCLCRWKLSRTLSTTTSIAVDGRCFYKNQIITILHGWVASNRGNATIGVNSFWWQCYYRGGQQMMATAREKVKERCSNDWLAIHWKSW